MKSTPIQSMEEITNIPPLCKRRECKAMIQATKYQCSRDHPMNKSTFLLACSLSVFFLTIVVCSDLVVIFGTEVWMVTFPSLSSQEGSFSVKTMGLTFFGKTSWCFLCKNRPTLFQRQSWIGSHNSCCTYHQVQSWQQHSSRIPDWCPLSVTSCDEWQPTSAWTGVIHHQHP
jgi:hypothetical protein